MSVHEQLIPLQSFLESRAHESVTGTGKLEDLEVHPEERQVNEERYDYQSYGTVNEMLGPVRLGDKIISYCNSHLSKYLTYHRMSLLDVQNFPQVPKNSGANGHKGEQAHHLASQGTSQPEPSGKQPSPPSPGKFLISVLVELDVAEKGKGHEKNESSVKENKSGLGNVTVVKENQSRRKGSNADRIARFSHDGVDNGDREGSEDRAEVSHPNVGDLSFVRHLP